MTRIPTLEPVTASPIVPETVEFCRTATAEQWEARMREKYPEEFAPSPTDRRA